jgi:hypothetical protein
LSNQAKTLDELMKMVREAIEVSLEGEEIKAKAGVELAGFQSLRFLSSHDEVFGELKRKSSGYDKCRMKVSGQL